MNACKHITFFNTPLRIPFLSEIIAEANSYPCQTDIFIHTNESFPLDDNSYNNGTVKVVVHNLGNLDPFYLSWKCRELIKTQQNEYDIFIYTEDDIRIPAAALSYWLHYTAILSPLNFNLGFVRVEENSGTEYCVDLTAPINSYLFLKEECFYLNHNNTYCGCWIYSQKEVKRFIERERFKLFNTRVDTPRRLHFSRELSAIGQHDMIDRRFSATLIPGRLEVSPQGSLRSLVHSDSRVYHLSKNYSSETETPWGVLPFKDCTKPTPVSFFW